MSFPVKACVSSLMLGLPHMVRLGLVSCLFGFSKFVSESFEDRIELENTGIFHPDRFQTGQLFV